MATQGEINKHNSLIERFTRTFARGLAPLLTQFYDQLSSEPTADRLAVSRLFQPIRRYADTQIANLTAILEDTSKINQEVLGSVRIDVSRLQAETLASMNLAIDQEVNNLAVAVSTAVLVGAISAATLTQLRSRRAAIVKRLAIAYSTSVRNADAAYTLLTAKASGKTLRYRYVGGIIAESRPFCRQHDGRTMTEAEIRRIWSTQNWQGKSPGDPFVVRGGYNCRHSFVPVIEP